MSRQKAARPRALAPRRLEFIPALAAAFVGSAAISFVLAWQGWLTVGMPPLAVLAYTIALAIWAPVRLAISRIALGIVSIVGMVVGLYALPVLAQLQGGAAT
jgi:hypothetical protein